MWSARFPQALKSLKHDMSNLEWAIAWRAAAQCLPAELGVGFRQRNFYSFFTA